MDHLRGSQRSSPLPTIVKRFHYTDVIMSLMASQITSLTIVYSPVCSGTCQRKHQSSASLAFVRGIHRGPVNSPHKRPATRKMFPFDDVIMFPALPDGQTALVEIMLGLGLSNLIFYQSLIIKINTGKWCHKTSMRYKKYVRLISLIRLGMVISSVCDHDPHSLNDLILWAIISSCFLWD